MSLLSNTWLSLRRGIQRTELSHLFKNGNNTTMLTVTKKETDFRIYDFMIQYIGHHSWQLSINGKKVIGLDKEPLSFRGLTNVTTEPFGENQIRIQTISNNGAETLLFGITPEKKPAIKPPVIYYLRP